MKAVLSNKIRDGRKLRQFSQQELADKLGVSKQMISKYEKGLSVPSSKILIKMARTFNVSLDYFFTVPAVELGNINFRKKSRLSKKRLDAISEEVRLKLSNYLEIENILKINNVFDTSKQIKKLTSKKDIVEIVNQMREQWQIGYDPIHNITQILEDQKIKVIEVSEEKNLIDGMATLIDDKYAVIVINENFPVERKRFTLLHELAHLVLDLPDCEINDAESYCNLFAAEFLFPKESVLREFGQRRNTIALREFIEAQQKYGMSIQAIFYRLVEFDIMSKNKQKSFYQRLNSDHELKELINKERFGTPEFSHRYKQLVYRAYSQELISGSKAAGMLNKNINEVLTKEMV